MTTLDRPPETALQWTRSLHLGRSLLQDERGMPMGAQKSLDSSPSPADQISSVGRYRILSELGRGAMARVYLALDPNIDRKIALKVLAPGAPLAADSLEDLRQRFLLEARAAGNLRHPSAVAIYDADHDPESGLSYIAMEWVDGPSLDRLLKRGDRLPIQQMVAITRDVASALDAAHRQVLIHRDVKPANILLDKRGNAKLSDFGIVKSEALDLTSTGQVLGTPNYMSPEQIRDEPLDGRSDLFSLGVVLYQGLTGELPFRGDSLPSITHKILNVDPRPPETINREIPPQIAAVVTRALAKDPDDRFQTGAAMSRSLAGENGPDSGLASSAGRSPTGTLVLIEPPEPAFWHGRFFGVLALFLTLAILLLLLPATRTGDGVDRPAEPLDSGAMTTNPSVGSARELAREPSKPVSGARFEGSRLEIHFTNRLRRGSIDVWVDGEQTLSRSFTGPKGLMKRTVGQSLYATIPVVPGHHDIKVRVRGSAGKLEASNWTGHSFSEGQTRRLKVEFLPPKFLRLTWK